MGEYPGEENFRGALARGELMLWLTAEGLPDEDRQLALGILPKLGIEASAGILDQLGRPVGVDEWMLDYGSWSSTYRELLPLVGATPERVVRAVGELATGIWEPALHDAFLAWCQHKPERIDKVVAMARDHVQPVWATTLALVAGLRMDATTYLGTAVEYSRGEHGSRMPGIRAIAGMEVSNPATVRAAVRVLADVVADEAAEMGDRADALGAALEVAPRGDDHVVADVVGMAGDAVASGHQELLRQCCLAATRSGDRIPEELLKVLLDALGRLQVSETGAYPVADMTLYSLLSRGREDAVVPMESLIRAYPGAKPFAGLESAAHYVAKAPALLSRIACRWLATGERPLCEAAVHLVTLAGGQDFVFDFDPGNTGWPVGKSLFTARKAIGWFMLHAAAAASFVVCLVPATGVEEAGELCKLLADPILVSYPLAARTYLERVAPGLPEPSGSMVVRVLAEHAAYLEAVERVGYIPELQPSERERWIELRRQDEAWSKARGGAESRSGLMSLFKRQTLLHGVAAVSYVEDPGGTVRRLENKLGTVSFTADNAMGWVYDPFELDHMLRVFRSERWPA